VKVSFDIYLILGGIALLIGWFLFYSNSKEGLIAFDSFFSKLYLELVLFSSIATVLIGFSLVLDVISSAGYVSLGFIWIYTSTKAFVYKKKEKSWEYKNMLMLSYVLCFSVINFCLGYSLPIFEGRDSTNMLIAWSWILTLLIALSFRTS